MKSFVFCGASNYQTSGLLQAQFLNLFFSLSLLRSCFGPPWGFQREGGGSTMPLQPPLPPVTTPSPHQLQLQRFLQRFGSDPTHTVRFEPNYQCFTLADNRGRSWEKRINVKQKETHKEQSFTNHPPHPKKLCARSLFTVTLSSRVRGGRGEAAELVICFQ